MLIVPVSVAVASSSWIDQPGATLLAAGLSALAGSLIGPIVLRRQRKGDTALDERRKWVKDKLVQVFGHGPQMSTDSVDYAVYAFVPPHPFTPINLDMHSINFRLEESLDLRLIQPRRSQLAQRWLNRWAWILHNEAFEVRSLADEPGGFSLPEVKKPTERYLRRLQAVESALTRWSLGTRPSVLFWLSLKFRAARIERRVAVRIAKDKLIAKETQELRAAQEVAYRAAAPGLTPRE